MKQRARAIATLLSAAIFIATIVLCVRSFFVYDSISSSNTTIDQVTPIARAYAKANDLRIGLSARAEGLNIESWRGHLTISHGLIVQPMDMQWPDFQARPADKRIWSTEHHSRSEDGYFPGGGAELNGFLGWLGFDDRASVAGAPRPSSYRWITLPLWPILITTAIAPAIWFRRHLRERHRRRHNLCLTCGYDLRGGAAGGACPDCGAAMVRASSHGVGGLVRGCPAG